MTVCASKAALAFLRTVLTVVSADRVVTDLAGGAFLTQRRNAVLIAGPVPARRTWPSRLRAAVIAAARGRFYNVVDPVNLLESETRNGSEAWLAEHLTRVDLIVLEADCYSADTVLTANLW
jgi:IstB-like ATP binding protein